MTTAKNAGRINVWPTYDIAREADTAESKFIGRLTVWPTYTEARANLSHEDEGGGGELEWLPEGALAFGDTQAEHYYAGAAEITVTQFFDNIDAEDATAFNADGMMPVDTVSAPRLSAAVLADAVAPCCIVVEFKPDDASDYEYLLSLMQRETPGTNSSIVAEIEVSLNNQELYVSETASGEYNKIGDITEDVVHRLAVNFYANGTCEGSLNGAAAVASTGGPVAWDSIEIGYRTANPFGNMDIVDEHNGRFRKIEVYELQDGAGLMAKSTVP